MFTGAHMLEIWTIISYTILSHIYEETKCSLQQSLTHFIAKIPIVTLQLPGLPYITEDETNTIYP